jgi:hypothetical protein
MQFHYMVRYQLRYSLALMGTSGSSALKAMFTWDDTFPHTCHG